MSEPVANLEADPKSCPMCGAICAADAKECAACGEELARRAAGDPLTNFDILMASIAVGIPFTVVALIFLAAALS